MLLTGACAQSLTPQQVADRFWRAVVTEHPSKMRRYVMASQRDQIDGTSEILPVASFSLGTAVIETDTARIETQLVLDGDTPVPVAVDTRLVLESGRWKVNYDATAQAISINGNLAEVIGQIAEIGDALKDGIDRSVDEMNRALPAIENKLKEFESRLRQEMPELRQRLEEFSRRLQESLEQAPADAPPVQQPPDKTIAL